MAWQKILPKQGAQRSVRTLSQKRSGLRKTLDIWSPHLCAHTCTLRCTPTWIHMHRCFLPHTSNKAKPGRAPQNHSLHLVYLILHDNVPNGSICHGAVPSTGLPTLLPPPPWLPTLLPPPPRLPTLLPPPPSPVFEVSSGLP